MVKVYRRPVSDASVTTGTGVLICLQDHSPASPGDSLGNIASSGDVSTLCIHDDYGNWEVAQCTVTITGTVVSLSRDTIIESSNSGSAVDFPAGKKLITNLLPPHLVNMLPIIGGGQNLLSQALIAATGATAATAASGTAATGSGTASITMGGNAANTTATNTAVQEARHVRYMAPLVGDLVSYAAALAVVDGAMVLLTQPDVPRKLQIRAIDANASLTCTVTVIGVGASGQALSQAISVTGGTATYTTADAYATITSITISATAGATAIIDTISVGPSNALGLPACKTPTPATFSVFKANVGGLNETVGTVDATAGTIVPNSTPNGVLNFDFWYLYNFTPTQAAHNHAATGLTATDGGHTHTGPSHTHTVTVTDPGHTHNLA